MRIYGRLPTIATAPILVALALGAGAAHAGEAANSVEFQPVFNAATGLELRVQNYSKLPRTLAGVDVFVGGNERTAACHVAVPGITLAPAARGTVVVADAKTVNGCLPGGAPARTSARLAGLDNIPSRTGGASTAPVPIERSVRIVPRFADTTDAEPQQLRFRLAK